MTPWWQMSAALQKHQSVSQSLIYMSAGWKTKLERMYLSKASCLSKWPSGSLVVVKRLVPSLPPQESGLRLSEVRVWCELSSPYSLSVCLHLINFCTSVCLVLAFIENLNEFKVRLPVSGIE